MADGSRPNRVTSSPSSFGIRMSTRHTSGRSLQALRAVGRLAHDLHAALGLEDQPEAGAHHLLVVGDQNPDGVGRPAGVSQAGAEPAPPDQKAHEYAESQERESQRPLRSRNTDPDLRQLPWQTWDMKIAEAARLSDARSGGAPTALRMVLERQLQDLRGKAGLSYQQVAHSHDLKDHRRTA